MLPLKRENNNDLLQKAIKKTDIETIKKLINNNMVNINESDQRQNTPLHLAVTRPKNLDIVRFLLDSGANIYAKNYHNFKPLHIAIQHDNVEVVLLLIERGALIGDGLNSFLLKAVERNNSTLVGILIEKGMQYNPSVDLRDTLNTAISANQSKIMELILPHCQFSESSSKYIPKELVIKREPQSKECVELLLKWNFSVNPACSRDGDFIYGAVDNGYLPIVLQLIKFGINVNMVNLNTGLTLLKLACLNKHYEIVKNLLKYNASINVTIPNDARIFNKYYYDDDNNHLIPSIWNPEDLWDIAYLYVAVINSDSAMIRFLLMKTGVKLDDPQFFNIVCVAVRNNCEEIVLIFLKCGINVNDNDAQGKCLLHFCVNSDGNEKDSRFNIAQMLLERGATKHLRTPGNSLIFEAINNGHQKTAQLFLDYNANIQYINPSNGDTPLHKAIENNFDVEFIKNLLRINAPIDAVNNAMLTPLLVACQTPIPHQFDIIQLLLLYNAHVNCRVDSENINSLLHIADPDENTKQLSSWLENKVNHNNNKNIRGQTPLHLICKYKTDETVSIIELLLLYLADIEASDAEGWTPLLVACYSNNYPAVKCLLENDANVNHTDKQDLTALYITAKYNKYNSDVVRTLLKHRVNVKFTDKQGKSIFHIIAEKNNGDVIDDLFHTRVNINSFDKEGDTPLHTAIRNKCAEVTASLIKYGADITIVDKKNCTPLKNAVKYMSVARQKFEDYRALRESTQHSRPFRSDAEKVGYNIWTHICDLNSYKEIIKSIKKQIVKLNVIGFIINDYDLKLVYDSDHCGEMSKHDRTDCAIDIEELERECKQEIERMKEESIDINVTFYDLLKKNLSTLGRYIKNKIIRQALKRPVYDKKFPLYIDIIRNRFREAKFRYKAVNSAKKYFYVISQQVLPEDCIDVTFDYLNTRDLKKFRKAMKPFSKNPMLLC